MAKNSGIRALKNLKIKAAKIGAPETQRASVPKKAKKAAAELPEMDSTAHSGALSADDFLEETPVLTAKKSRFEKPDSRNDFVDEPLPSTRSARNKNRKQSIFSSAMGAVLSLFDKPSGRGSKQAALAFASNNKRLGKKGRRNRLIFMYAGTAFVVVAVLLVLVLVPGGAAAPAEADVTGGNRVAANVSRVPGISPSPTVSAAAPTGSSPTPVQPAIGVQAVGSPEPLQSETASPEPTETPEPTQSPEPIKTTAPDPTQMPIDMDELIDYFVVDAKAYYNDMGYSSNHYKYSDSELYMLAQIIDIEARGESFEGKVAVGNVVMNRVLCRTFPGSTIKDVITRPGQFAYAGREDRKPSSSSKRAARAVLDDQRWVIPQDVYYFRSGAPANENWGSHKFYTKIGGHCFYRHSYSGRHRGGDAPPALFERTYKYAQYGCKPEKRVYRIQYMLNKLGYDVYADSYFGESTKVELMKFQEKHGLDADGVAGRSTVKALIKEFGTENYYKRFVK